MRPSLSKISFVLAWGVMAIAANPVFSSNAADPVSRSLDMYEKILSGSVAQADLGASGDADSAPTRPLPAVTAAARAQDDLPTDPVVPLAQARPSDFAAVSPGGAGRPDAVTPPSQAPKEIAPPKEEGLDLLASQETIDLLELKDMPIADVLKLLSQKSGLNIIAGANVTGRVTIFLRDVRMEDALRIILDANNLAYKVDNGIARIMPAVEFESRYGYPFGGDIRTQIVRVQYAEPADVQSMLTQIQSSKGRIIADTKSKTLVLMDTPDKLRVMQELVREMDTPVETRIYDLGYALSKDISEKVTPNLTPNVGQLRFDERSNKLIVTDTPAKIRDVSSMIEAFDTKEKQVLIEAKIVQVVLSDQNKFGVGLGGDCPRLS